MAESTLSPKYSDFRADIGWRLGYTRTPANWSSEQTSQILDTLKAAQRRVYTAHRWRFMEPSAELTTVEPYSTGTVTIVAGVVTLASGTFPSWAADGDLIVSNVAYSINTRDSGSQVTLDDLTVAASAGSTYELARSAYTLDDNFGGMVGPLYYVPENNRWKIIPIVGLGDILARRQSSARTGTIQCAAIRPKAFVTATGQRYEFLPYPMADAIYRLIYKYRAIPDHLTSDNYPLGGEIIGETLRLACLVQCEALVNDGANLAVVKQEYMESLQRSIAMDSDLYAPDRLGYNGDPSNDSPDFARFADGRGLSSALRYNGTQYTD